MNFLSGSCRVAVAVLIVSCSQTIHAQTTNAPARPPGPKFVVTPDHANGIYAANEKVTWTVDVTGDRSGLSELPYAIKEDGQVQTGGGTLNLSTGPGTITASRSTPGVLVAQIFPALAAGAKLNSSGTPLAVGGAVIAPDKIGPFVTAPADFDAFWKDQLKKLAAVPVNPVVEQGDISLQKDAATLDYYKVTLDNINGTHVYGQLARPKAGDKFPAMLMVQSAGVYPLDQSQLIYQSKWGWLVLNISAHDAPIDQPKDFYANLQKTTLADYPFIGCEDRETSYFLRMFLGCARAVEYLKSRPDWDGKTLIVTGASQGGMQSFATAYLCPEVTAVIADVPAGCDLQGPLATPPRAFGWPYWISNMGPKGRDMKKVAVTAGYYDTINFAAHTHCPTLVGVGLIDDTARPTGVIAAYNAVSGPKKLIIMPLSDHHGSNNSQQAYYAESFTWKSNMRAGKPLPVVGMTAQK